ncbi:MAG TPA: FG-GAP-like repeat-containing protein [Nevskiaceae bacterium]|nr:FG-GAP-like repeat-containing protein [Nevskiaceae bacterium]
MNFFDRTLASVHKVVVAALAVALGSMGFAVAAPYPDGPPNDASYGQQHNVWDYIPAQTYPLATDAEGAAGMSIEKAWRDPLLAGARTGRKDLMVAYLEGGINWNLGDISKDLVNKVYLNRGELPCPRDAAGKTRSQLDPSATDCYDLNGDGVFNIQDYASDGRVSDRNGNGFLDPEDLIAIFSDGTDDDGNGYVDDISGWDFYNNQNDPATLDATYPHSDAQMRKAAAEANNGLGFAGMCPDCRILPVKVGAEALDRADDLARGILYAIDAGASVVTTENAVLGYSTLERQVLEYAWQHDVLIAETTNDFDSTDHQGAMYWPHDIPGNGLVADQSSLPVISSPVQPTTALTTTFRVRSGQTSWGTKSLLSVATLGGSTSESTGTLGGVLGMLRSAAKEFSPAANPITAAEVVQVAIATASDVTASDGAKWPVTQGWDLQTGYGRYNVWEAMDAMRRQDIPPVAWFDTPDWFTLYDPTQVGTVAIGGHVEARRSPSYQWKLEWATGGEPADDSWQTISHGAGQVPYSGELGVLDLSRISAAFYAAQFALSSTKTLETNEQYTVTLRLTVTDAAGKSGVERRSIAVHHDDSWFPGFPVRTRETGTSFAPGGESQPALVDLQGLGHLAIVYGDSDGHIHALDPLTRKELPGFPATTDPTELAPVKPRAGIEASFEPMPQPVAVGDLDHDGRLWIVGTTTNGKVYVWDDHGARRAGWPQLAATGVQPPAVPRQPRQYARPPHQGAFAAPTLSDLDGDGTLEIIQAAWDGRIHVYRNDGSGELPGWPVKVELPSSSAPPQGYVLIDDQKLESNVLVADIDGDGKPELVVRSQQAYSRGGDIQPLGLGHAFAYHADGTLLSGWPVTMPSVIHYYGSAQEFITEGSNSPVGADIDGDGKVDVAVNPVFSPAVYVFNGDGTPKLAYGAALDLSNHAVTQADLSNLLGLLPADLSISFTTTGAFGKFGPGKLLTFAQAGSDTASVANALLFTGSGGAIRNSERAFVAAAGVPQPGFPSMLQGLDFLGAPLFVDVDGDGAAEIIDGGDTSALHGFRSGGGQAAGFPKWTTGWMLWSASAGDLDSDGTTDLVALTREGYVMAWKTPGISASNNEWWHYRHDEWNTGRYGADTRPPGVARDVKWDVANHRLSFTAPGDNWYAGTVSKYRVAGTGTAGVSTELEFSSTDFVPAGQQQSLNLPADMTSGTVQAVDAAGNLGRRVAFPGSSNLPNGASDTPAERSRFGGPISAWSTGILLLVQAFRRRRIRPG